MLNNSKTLVKNDKKKFIQKKLVLATNADLYFDSRSENCNKCKS